MLDKLPKHLHKQAHKFAVQTTIFCPQCGNVLDVKTSTSVTVYDHNNQPVYSKVFCAKHLQPGYAEAQEKLCKAKNFRSEFYHGKSNTLEVIQ